MHKHNKNFYDPVCVFKLANQNRKSMAKKEEKKETKK